MDGDDASDTAYDDVKVKAALPTAAIGVGKVASEVYGDLQKDDADDAADSGGTGGVGSAALGILGGAGQQGIELFKAAAECLSMVKAVVSVAQAIYQIYATVKANNNKAATLQRRVRRVEEAVKQLGSHIEEDKQKERREEYVPMAANLHALQTTMQRGKDLCESWTAHDKDEGTLRRFLHSVKKALTSRAYAANFDKLSAELAEHMQTLANVASFHIAIVVDQIRAVVLDSRYWAQENAVDAEADKARLPDQIAEVMGSQQALLEALEKNSMNMGELQEALDRHGMESRKMMATLDDINAAVHDMQDMMKMQNDLLKMQKAIESAAASGFKISFAKLKIGAIIGVGGNSTCYRAMFMGNDVAVKMFRSECDRDVAIFHHEVDMISKLRNPNIVNVFGACYPPDPPCLVAHFVPRSLFSAIDSLSWNERVRIGAGIASALQFLHDLTPPVIHRDVKSRNVLLKADGTPLLCDFGKAKRHSKNATAAVRAQERTILSVPFVPPKKAGNNSPAKAGAPKAGTPSSRTPNSGNPDEPQAMVPVGTLAWMAPELLSDYPAYSGKSDVYAFGMLLYEIASAKTPFASLTNPLEVKDAIKRGDRPPIEDQWAVPEAFVSLMQDCWRPAPSGRPNAEDAFEALTDLQTTMEVPDGEHETVGTVLPPWKRDVGTHLKREHGPAAHGPPGKRSPKAAETPIGHARTTGKKGEPSPAARPHAATGGIAHKASKKPVARSPHVEEHAAGVEKASATGKKAKPPESNAARSAGTGAGLGDTRKITKSADGSDDVSQLSARGALVKNSDGKTSRSYEPTDVEMREMLKRLAAPEEAVRANAATALGDLIDASEELWRSKVAQSREVVSLLVEMLGRQSEDDSEREAAARLSLKLAVGSELKARLVDAGALDPLVTLLENGSPAGKASAAAVLASLLREPELRQAVILAAPTALLVVVLMNGTADAKESAADALTSLSSMSEGAELVAIEGAVEPLVGLVRDGSPDGRQFAARALRNIAADERFHAELVAANAPEPLVQLVQDGTDEAKSAAAATILCLSNTEEHTATVVKAGAVGALVGLLNSAAGATGKRDAAGALWRIAGDKTHRKTVLAAGGADALRSLARDGTAEQRDTAEKALEQLHGKTEK